MLLSGVRSGFSMIGMILTVAIIVLLVWFLLPVVVGSPSPGGGVTPTVSLPAYGEEELRIMVRQPMMIANGQMLYATSGCATCHGPHGEGGMLGPNLRDDHWLHGAHLTDLARDITKGFPEKQMPAWGLTYSREQIATLVAYVVSLRGGTVGVDKAPEGPLEPLALEDDATLTPP